MGGIYSHIQLSFLHHSIKAENFHSMNCNWKIEKLKRNSEFSQFLSFKPGLSGGCLGRGWCQQYQGYQHVCSVLLGAAPRADKILSGRGERGWRNWLLNIAWQGRPNTPPRVQLEDCETHQFWLTSVGRSPWLCRSLIEGGGRPPGQCPGEVWPHRSTPQGLWLWLFWGRQCWGHSLLSQPPSLSRYCSPPSPGWRSARPPSWLVVRGWAEDDSDHDKICKVVRL